MYDRYVTVYFNRHIWTTTVVTYTSARVILHPFLGHKQYIPLVNINIFIFLVKPILVVIDVVNFVFIF